MSMELAEVLEHVNNILGIELNENQKLDGEKLEKLKTLLGISWTPETIYFTKTNLIMTDINDYQKLKEVVKKFEDVLKIEMTEFNTYIFVCRYSNSPELTTILLTEDEDV